MMFDGLPDCSFFKWLLRLAAVGVLAIGALLVVLIVVAFQHISVVLH